MITKVSISYSGAKTPRCLEKHDGFKDNNVLTFRGRRLRPLVRPRVFAVDEFTGIAGFRFQIPRCIGCRRRPAGCNR